MPTWPPWLARRQMGPSARRPVRHSSEWLVGVADCVGPYGGVLTGGLTSRLPAPEGPARHRSGDLVRSRRHVLPHDDCGRWVTAVPLAGGRGVPGGLPTAARSAGCGSAPSRTEAYLRVVVGSRRWGPRRGFSSGGPAHPGSGLGAQACQLDPQAGAFDLACLGQRGFERFVSLVRSPIAVTGR